MCKMLIINKIDKIKMKIKEMNKTHREKQEKGKYGLRFQVCFRIIMGIPLKTK